MKREEAKQIISDYINDHNQVSYTELEMLFQQIGYEYKGPFDITSEKNDHVVFWGGWNKETIELFNELQQEGKIHKEATELFTYLIDGGGMNLPVFESEINLKRDHWLPIVFSGGPEEVQHV